jgi:hypothetical protein
MRRLFAALILLAWVKSSGAYITLPKEPILHKMALANCVVVGKITAIRKEPVNARLYLSQDAKAKGTKFTIAEVQITEAIAGVKEQKKILIGFIGHRDYKPAPAVGLEGCFFAVKHWDENFYVVPVGCFHAKSDPDFEKDVKLARRCGLALSDPAKGLKSKAANDRLLAANLLLLRYTYTPIRYGGNMKGEAIGAEESKLILRTLAEADWSQPDPETKVSPQMTISWLYLSAIKLGSPLAKSFPSKPEEVKKWLKENAETYRIQKLVPAKAEEKK